MKESIARRRALLSKGLGEGRQELLRTWGPGAALTVLGFAIAWLFVEPAPPSTLTIAAGPRHGAYFAFAQRYATLLAQHGVTLDVRETAGSIENYRLLATDEQVHLAIVQGGTAPGTLADDELETLASLYLEPVWIFTHGTTRRTSLRELKGRRIAVGADDSGTQEVALELLAANGYLVGDADMLVRAGGEQAADLLRSGDVQAAFFVLAPRSQLVSELLRDQRIRLMDLERQQAYRRRFPYLSAITLEQGVIDLAENVPEETIRQIAPAANLVAAPALHDAFIPLLLEAAQRTHERGGIYYGPGEFPSQEFAEFPSSPITRHYFESGPSLLQRYLPFWLASLVDRMKIMLLPLVMLAFPVVKLAPPVYRWRIRSRIYRWYSVLRDIDQRLRHEAAEEVEKHVQTLRRMEAELQEITVPLSYMEEFYNLRLHIDLVHRRIVEATSNPANADHPPRSETPSDD